MRSNSNLRCRLCDASNLVPVLSLGQMPLVNALLYSDSLPNDEARFPLDLAMCTNCSLVQITEIVSPKLLFADYPYYSSVSETMVNHAKELVDRLIAERCLGIDSCVYEIGSNDGYLLQHYLKKSVSVTGIEPATTVANKAEENSIATIREFFDLRLAQRLRDEGTMADVIHAHNVMAHIPALNNFAAALKVLLKPGGIAVIEVPYIRDLIENCAFDTIYHEHVFYFSITAAHRLFTKHGFHLSRVEHMPIHGGSLRIFLSNGLAETKDTIIQQLAEEEELGLTEPAYYLDFGGRVKSLGTSLRCLLDNYKRQGKRIAAYGASAKGCILLNTFGLGQDKIDYVVDRSSEKQGRFTPGTHLPILSPNVLVERMPDAVLLLTWNLADEILCQQAEYRRNGGLFIIPIPELKVV